MPDQKFTFIESTQYMPVNFWKMPKKVEKTSVQAEEKKVETKSVEKKPDLIGQIAARIKNKIGYPSEEEIMGRKEVISKAPSEWSFGRIKQRMQEFLSEVPLLGQIVEKPAEIALRKEALEKYPITETFKNFAKEIHIEEKSPKEEPALGLVEGKKPYSGISLPRRRFKSFVETIVSPLAPKTEMEITNLSSETVMHEMLHSYLYEVGMPRPWKQFNEDWEANKENYPPLKDIDQNLFSNSGYREAIKNEDYLAAERFAWLGEAMGKYGQKNIPDELREYYKDVFK